MNATNIKVTKEVKHVLIHTGGAYMRYVDLPAGLLVRLVPPYPSQTRTQYWLHSFPVDIFPLNSIERHDAEHYGVWLNSDQVQDATAGS